jgi:hypothetical protein
MTFQDETTRRYQYDAASDVTGYTDENGSAFLSFFDPVGRKIQCVIAPASGVAGSIGNGRGTTLQLFQYDGLSRMTFSRELTNVDGAAPLGANVNLYYDSLSRTAETRSGVRAVAPGALNGFRRLPDCHPFQLVVG